MVAIVPTERAVVPPKNGIDSVGSIPVRPPSAQTSARPQTTEAIKVTPTEFHPRPAENLAYQVREIDVMTQRHIFGILGERILIAQKRLKTQKDVTEFDLFLVKLAEKNQRLQTEYEAHLTTKKIPEFKASANNILTVEELTQLDFSLRITASEMMEMGGYVLDESRTTPAVELERQVQEKSRFRKEKTVRRTVEQKGKLKKTAVSLMPFSPGEMPDAYQRFLSKDPTSQMREIYDLIYEEQQLRTALIGYDTQNPEFENDKMSIAVREARERILQKQEYQGQTLSHLMAQDAARYIKLQGQAVREGAQNWAGSEMKEILEQTKSAVLTGQRLAEAQTIQTDLETNGEIEYTTKGGKTSNKIEYDQIQKDITNITAKLSTLQNELKPINDRTRSLTKEKDVAEGKINSLTASITERKARRTQLESDLTSAKPADQKTKLSEILQISNSELPLLEKELVEETNKKQTAETDLIEHTTETSTKQAELDKEIKSLKAELKTEQDKKAGMKKNPDPQKANQIGQVVTLASTRLSQVESYIMVEGNKEEALKSMQSIRDLLGLDYDILDDHRLRKLLAQLLHLTDQQIPDVDDNVNGTRKKWLEAQKLNPSTTLADAQITDPAEIKAISDGDELNEAVLSELRLQSAPQLARILLSITSERLAAASAGRPTEDYGIREAADTMLRETGERTKALRTKGIIEGFNSSRFMDGVDIDGVHYEIIAQGGQPVLYKEVRNQKGNVSFETTSEKIGLVWIPQAGSVPAHVEPTPGLSQEAMAFREKILREIYIKQQEQLDGKKTLPNGDKIDTEFRDGVLYVNLGKKQGIISFRDYARQNPDKFKDFSLDFLTQEAGRPIVAPDTGLVDAGIRVSSAETALAATRGEIKSKNLDSSGNFVIEYKKSATETGNIRIRKDGSLNLTLILDPTKQPIIVDYPGPFGVENYLTAINILVPPDVTNEPAAQNFRESLSQALFMDFLHRTSEDMRSLPFISEECILVKDIIDPSTGSTTRNEILTEIFKNSDGEIMIRNVKDGEVDTLAGFMDRMNQENTRSGGNNWSTQVLPFIEQQTGNRIFAGLSNQIRKP